MKQIIRGDKEPVHIVAASRALEAHMSRYGEGNKYHPVIYSIAYRSKYYQVEVITRRETIVATVITGVRNLTHLPGVA
ncbi:DUF4060 family protein [Pantoea allii]|jgi:hypothetical protein|uniref:DUF4060 family protein n=1 Tax=Pantoea allii TaxID=574096 RepID=A0A2V2BSK8_9GAMM|nr:MULTISPECIES: DUF4060 family protein [Pantoea]MBW1212107.1 DUF4060 family protein [Pantoea allii]MBW1255386.1 DUF4060 family protein [Pantoea allii]MBW1256255.1 DUF4060 family protein [Pantoea allii]MBW1264483.1 DUF4060 family protein [Pantoea allii]MBW1265332.1 DUF4060 family protein [Pantoea allii]